MAASAGIGGGDGADGASAVAAGAPAVGPGGVGGLGGVVGGAAADGVSTGGGPGRRAADGVVVDSVAFGADGAAVDRADGAGEGVVCGTEGAAAVNDGAVGSAETPIPDGADRSGTPAC